MNAPASPRRPGAGHREEARCQSQLIGHARSACGNFLSPPSARTGELKAVCSSIARIAAEKALSAGTKRTQAESRSTTVAIGNKTQRRPVRTRRCIALCKRESSCVPLAAKPVRLQPATTTVFMRIIPTTPSP